MGRMLVRRLVSKSSSYTIEVECNTCGQRCVLLLTAAAIYIDINAFVRAYLWSVVVIYIDINAFCRFKWTSTDGC